MVKRGNDGKTVCPKSPVRSYVDTFNVDHGQELKDMQNCFLVSMALYITILHYRNVI